jgi:Amt family ammonium transporter
MVGLCVGAVAGLATITPAAGFVRPWAACLIGFLAAVLCYLCVELRKKMGWDDALDVWGVHGMGGVFGTILLGAVGQVGGVTASWELVGKQLAAVVLVAVYAFVLSYILLKICDKLPGVGPLKPSTAEIASGLDHTTHKERAYSFRITAKLDELSAAEATEATM